MGKKDKKAGTLQTQQPVPGLFSDPRALRSFRWGGALLLLGFFCLACTDAYGANWASWFSPLALVSGYFLIALSLFLPPSPPPPTP